MYVFFKNHSNKLIFFLFITIIGCQLKDPDQNHGILFIENRSNKLVINESNKNDVIKIFGKPHTKSFQDDNIWIYLERILTKGKYHKLGRHIIKKNNVLVLNFDKYGVLLEKKIYTKEDIKKLSFTKDNTENQLSKKSFVETFLSSLKEKMYSRNK